MNIQSPLYITGVNPQGIFLLGGTFQMQDRLGFPIDCSFEEAKRHNHAIDFLEAFADCWLNDCLKFDSFSRQCELLVPQANLIEQFKLTGATILALNPEMKQHPNPIDEVCRRILATKQQTTTIITATTTNEQT